MRWLIVLLLFLSTSTKAQIHFPDSSAQWVYYCAYISWVIGEEDIYYFDGNDRHFLNGDTIINGLEYTKVYFEDDAHGGTPDTSYATFLGALRVDERKVYYRGEIGGYDPFIDTPDSIPDDVLLYDFGASVGDTLLHVVNYRDTYNGVDSVYSVVNFQDSSYTAQGWLHSYSVERFVSYFGDNGSWTNQHADVYAFEPYGGSVQGLFEPVNHPFFEGGCELFCFNSPVYTYDWDSFASCDNVGIDDNENRVDNCLNYSQRRIISSCASSNSVISVYDMTGKLVISETGSNKGVDCSAITDGIYLAVLQSEKQRSVLKFAVTR